MKRHFVIKFIRKLLLIVLILVAPLIVLAIALYPFIFVSNTQKYVEHYRLPKGFSRDNIAAVVAQMRKDTEYQFYFKVMEQEDINEAVDAAYQVLDKSRDNDQHFRQMAALKDRIQSTAVSLNNISYPDDFADNPLVYPELLKKFRSFLDDEFQLTILGLSYKATYDSHFQFSWSDAAKLSAHKMESIFNSLTDEQRQKFEKYLRDNLSTNKL